jgi:hypothetical protein
MKCPPWTAAVAVCRSLQNRQTTPKVELERADGVAGLDPQPSPGNGRRVPYRPNAGVGIHQYK